MEERKEVLFALSIHPLLQNTDHECVDSGQEEKKRRCNARPQLYSHKILMLIELDLPRLARALVLAHE